jgi:hypothetical protein
MRSLRSGELSAPGGFHGVSTYSLFAQPDGTTLVESEGRFTFENSFAQFMTPVIVYEAKKKLKMDLERLRQLLEGGK